MKSNKFGLRALGLAILGALSLTAFMAVGAQAAEFQISGKAALLATATGTQEGKGFLLVAGRNLKLECETGDVLAGSEIINSKEGLAKVRFLNCVALNHKTGEPLPCTVGPLGNKQVEATAILLPVDVGGTKYVLAEPDGPAGTNFAVVTLGGAECPLPASNPVTGAVVAQVIVNNSVVNLVTFSQAIQEKVGDKLTFGGFPAFINASATIELTGVTHTGLKFGVL